MSIELPTTLEDQLREVALRRGQNIENMVEEAVRQYLAIIAITDLDSADVAETQLALLPELPDIDAWGSPNA